MIAIPALAIQGGDVVRFTPGASSRGAERVGAPREVARRWESMGFRRLHIIDLDAGAGRAPNAGPIAAVVAESTLPLLVGGGVTSASAADSLFDGGATWVVVGPESLDHPAWLESLVARHEGRVVVWLRARERKTILPDYPAGSARQVLEVAEELMDLAIGGVLLTAEHRDGWSSGPDLRLLDDVLELDGAPVLVSGGIRSHDQLRAIAECGAAGAVIGHALYAGDLDAQAVADEFSA